MMTCQISDGSGILTLRFFNFTAAMKNNLAQGKQVIAYGEIKRGSRGPEIIHPEYKIKVAGSEVKLQETLTPIYSTTEGLRQTSLRKLIEQALTLLDTCAINELLPDQFIYGLPPLATALRTLHNPPPDIAFAELEKGQHPAQKRLIIEELLAHNLGMLNARAGAQSYRAEPLLMPHGSTLREQFLATLPFTPTTAQQRVVNEIEQDLEKIIL